MGVICATVSQLVSWLIQIFAWSIYIYCTTHRPDDTAFKGVSADLITKLLTPGFVLHLRNLLGYHVTTATPERVLSSDLMDGMVLEMLNGENVTIATEGGGVSVVDGFGTSTKVTSADQLATDGNLHIINGLLSPAFFSTDLIKLATQYDQFSILAALMKASGADKSVPGDQDFTILAPNDAA